MKNEKNVWFLIRLGITFAFLYPAIMIHINPDNWIGYFPVFINQLSIPEWFLLGGFSLVHAIVGLWILSGKHIFIPSLLATLFLAGVILTNINQMDVLFRDVSLMIITVALALKSKTSSASSELS